MIRTYLEWMVSLPWDNRSEEHLDVAAAREVLDADHAGLDEVKERILEYLAVRRLRRERGMDDGRSGVILTLVGPPGTGKTSLGESVARALGREFARISLGGIRDEAEIRGHRRTYVGALPGRLVRALRDAGTLQPGDHARRDRQGRRRLARRPVVGPARGARPGAEPHASATTTSTWSSTSRRSCSSPPANVPDTIPGAAARPDGGHRPRRLHRGREARHRARLPAPAPDRAERPARGRGGASTDDALRSVIGDYTREAGVREPGARARQGAAQGGAPGGRRVAEGRDHDRPRRPARTPSGGRSSTTRRPSARRRRASRPAWR